MGAIYFVNHGINPHLKDTLLLKTALASVFASEKVDFESVNYIFCKDEYLVNLNQKYLNHNTLTDILTFTYSDAFLPIISEIYISVERVKQNAKLFRVNYQNELQRVMIHGILHLCGYEDSSAEQKVIMRAKEDFYLSRL